MVVRYHDEDKAPKEDRQELLDELEENGPMKPWTLISRVDGNRKALKELTLEGEIRITADGDIRTKL